MFNYLIKSTFIVWLYFLSLSLYSQVNKIEYYENGSIKTKRFHNPNGSHWKIDYYEEGSVKDSLLYVNNKLNGTAKYYNRKGRLTNEIDYKDGIKNGLEKMYFKKDIIIVTNVSGKKDKVFHVVHYYKNGVKHEEYNQKFVFEGYGPKKSYYKNGNLKIEGNYSKTKRKGVWNFYNEDGSLIRTKNYD